MDQGEQFARDMLAQYPDDWETRCELVDTLARRGHMEDAVAVIEDAPELPTDSSHLFKLVEVYSKANPHTAIALLRGIVAADPGDAKAHLAFADVYATVGNGAKAREYYRSCLKLRPEFRDKALEKRIGIHEATPVIRVVDKEQLQTARSQAIQETASTSSSRAPRRLQRAQTRTPRSNTSIVVLVITITLTAVIAGIALILKLR